MPFSMQITSTSRPCMRRRLSTEEATRLIRIARRKSSDGASSKHRNLRVFLGHSHIAETLKHEFVDFDQQCYSNETRTLPHPQHIEYADSAVQQSATEDDALTFEDDGEEDFCSLALVRTPSRSSQPPRSPV